MQHTAWRKRLSARVAGLVVAPALAAIALVGAVASPASALSESYLGYDIDQCSGNLYVKNSSNVWVFIPRDDVSHPVDVHVDGNGYWYWKCGTTAEMSRAVAAYRYRVDRLKVTHSSDSRQIRWSEYELF